MGVQPMTFQIPVGSVTTELLETHSEQGRKLGSYDLAINYVLKLT